MQGAAFIAGDESGYTCDLSESSGPGHSPVPLTIVEAPAPLFLVAENSFQME